MSAEAKKQLFWNLGFLKPKFLGVELVGNNVKLEGSILSGFSSSSYAKMPFTFSLMDKPWMFVLGFKYATSAEPMGIVTQLGDGDGWGPVFVGANYAAANMNKQQTYLNGVGWPITWSNGSVVARGFEDNIDYCIYIAFDGIQTYSTGDVGGEPLATKTSSALCNGSNLAIVLGNNRGNSLPFSGSIDLSKSYVVYDGELLWEGELGAYERVQRMTRS